MLQMVENTPQKLILRDRQYGALLTGVGFLLISVLALSSTIAQAAQRISMDGGIDIGRLVALLVFFGAELVFVAFALLILSTRLHGITLTVDRAAESVTLARGGVLRAKRHTFSIYAVSHLRIEQSPDGQALALMLVLRSGQQHFIATLPAYAKEEALRMVTAARAILHQ